VESNVPAGDEGQAPDLVPIVIQHPRGSGVDRQTDKTQIRHPSVTNDISLPVHLDTSIGKVNLKYDLYKHIFTMKPYVKHLKLPGLP